MQNLNEYFSEMSSILEKQYKLSKFQEHSTIQGTNREGYIVNLLRNILPPKLRVHQSGHIIAKAEGGDILQSSQMDIIITRDDCPTLHFGGINSYFVEGVFAVIEVKSDFQNGAKGEIDKLHTTFTQKNKAVFNAANRVFQSGNRIVNIPFYFLFVYDVDIVKNSTFEGHFKDTDNDFLDMVIYFSNKTQINGNVFIRPHYFNNTIHPSSVNDSNTQDRLKKQDKFWELFSASKECPLNQLQDGPGLPLSALFYVLMTYGTDFGLTIMNFNHYFDFSPPRPKNPDNKNSIYELFLGLAKYLHAQGAKE